MSDTFRILAINPGSTSTKIGYFENEKEIFSDNIKHSDEELKKFPSIAKQKDARLEAILSKLKEKKVDISSLSAVVGRGGLLKPLKSGTYEVNESMLKDMTEAKRGEHASNLGSILAYLVAKKAGVKVYIVDPVSVDEIEDVARISGTPEIERESLSHALNTKAVCKRYAKDTKKSYDKLNLIVAHLGSGISVTAHTGGRMIDVINPKEEGPFAMDRCGGVPSSALTKLCFSGKYDFKTLKKKLFGDGGFFAYLGTKDLKKVKEMIREGNEKAKLLFEAMIYQIAKEIGSLSTVLKGKLDAILITGGMANDQELIAKLIERVSFLGEVNVYPGEDELMALVEGTLRVLNDEEKALTY